MADRKVVAVMYDAHGRPFGVVTLNERGGWDEWDFDWCERDGALHCHKSGSGQAGAYCVSGAARDRNIELWVDQSIERFADFNGSPLSRSQVEAMGYTFLSAPKGDPFADALEREVAYCSVCDDHFPADDTCNHLVWVMGVGMVGCGSDIQALSHKKSFLQLLGVLGADVVRRMVVSLAGTGDVEWSEWKCLCPCGEAALLTFEDPVSHEDHGVWDEDDELGEGMAWLSSLEPGRTTEAVALTVQWMREFLEKEESRG